MNVLRFTDLVAAGIDPDISGQLLILAARLGIPIQRS